ncbi:MAG: CCA tRNA nucleotidyltransferase [Solirubrobacterales bacterium]
MQKNLKDFISELKKIGMDHEGTFYIVGGYIRDKLIDSKLTPNDIDIVYGGDLELLIKNLVSKGYSFYERERGIFSTDISGFRADISKLRGSSIEEDLNMRDYTINANALNLIDMKVVDPFKGRNAIKNRVLQEVNENSLKEDPIRILRGMKLYIKHGFHFSLHTEEHVVEAAPMLKEINDEGLLNEFLDIIQCDKAGRAFELMDNYKILENILPYINELKTIGKSDYKELDVFSHMDLTYKTYKELLSGILALDNFDLAVLNKPLGDVTLSEYLAFACFIHDIGKYMSLDNYQLAGVEIAEKVCNELKFPKEGAEIVTTVIKEQGTPYNLFKINDTDKLIKEIDKFFNENDKYIPFILITAFCDNYAEKIIFDQYKEKEKFKQFIERLFRLFGEYNKVIEIH